MEKKDLKLDQITTGDIQAVSVDLTKFDKAKQVVSTAKEMLKLALIINNTEDQQWSLSVLKDTSVVIKAIEAKRVELVKPFNDASKQINAYAKELSAEMEKLIVDVKAKVLEFQKAEELKAKQAMITARHGQLAQLGFVFNSNTNRFDLEGLGSIASVDIETSSDMVWTYLINTYTESIRLKNLQQVAQLEEEKELTAAFGSDEDVEVLNTKLQQANTPVVAPTATAVSIPSPVKGTMKRWTFQITNNNSIPREYLIVDETAIRKAIAAGVREIPGVNIFQTTSLSIR